MTNKQSAGNHFVDIQRVFTIKHQDPYHNLTFRWVKYQNTEIEVPNTWSENAIRMVREKYLRKAGVPNISELISEENVPKWLCRRQPAKNATLGQETSFKQFFERLVGGWTYWGWKGKYFNSEEEAKIFYDELLYIISHQIALANSPQCFNTGLHWAYGIKGEHNGRQFYVDPDTDETIQSECGYERPQPHACFIMSIKDQLIGTGGIMDHWHKEALMFKYGSGVGSNFSPIRGTNEPLSSGGVSSGLPSWLLIGDRAAGAVKSGGTTRRAAKMVILDIDHPDIEQFIRWKTLEEEKLMYIVTGSQSMRRHAQKIIEAASNPKELAKRIDIARINGMPQNYIDRLVSGLKQNYQTPELKEYNNHWDGEGVKSLSGQNSNNTVSVTDAFMKLIDTNKDFGLIRRTDGSVHKTVKAKHLWQEIVYNAWAIADPGLHFRDTINAWHTCPQDGPINASNPCSEYMFLDDTACNLASINLVTLLKADKFEHHLFAHACKLFTMVLEISVHMAQFPSEAIARRSYDFRTLGLGYANIGGLLMRLGLGYDSDEGRAIAGSITSLMTGVAYKTSAQIAAKLGPFKHFQKNRTDMLRVIRNHSRACNARSDKYEQLNIAPTRLIPSQTQYDIYDCAQKVWKEVEVLGDEYGFRNAQTTVLAPTGTIGLVMDCDTLGCEPDFALVKGKELASGGWMQIVNNSVPYALKKLNYTDEQVSEIIEYICGKKDFNNNITPVNAQSLAKAGINSNQIELATAYDLKSLHKDIALHFTQEEINKSNLYYFGTKTIEGAPHIKDKDLHVFDCANNCGPFSKRSLHWHAHIKMLAVMQPFLSGSISKTINLEANATIKEFDDSIRAAYKAGLKCVAQYRDGSKSQPLSAFTNELSIKESNSIQSITEDLIYDIVKNENISLEKMQEDIMRALHKPVRRELPPRRYGYTQKVHIGRHKLLWRTGEYSDGTLGEIFIDTHKEGATFRSLMNGFAILFSLALQYGVPLAVLYRAFKDMKFDPSGFITGHDNIRFASSIFGLIVTDLWENYGDGPAPDELNNASKNKTSTMRSEYSSEHEAEPDTIDNSKIKTNISEHESRSDTNDNPVTQNFSGEICKSCGMAEMIKSGTCEVCLSCGNTSGCG